MKNTNNYNLPLFESGDKFNKETINETNTKIDLAISDLQETFNANATTGGLTTQEVINARKGKESLKDKIDEIDVITQNNKTQMNNIIQEEIPNVVSHKFTLGGQLSRLKSELCNPLCQILGINFVGDSITWGLTLPNNNEYQTGRDGTLSDKRDNFISDSWVNLFKRYIGQKYSNNTTPVLSNWSASPSGESICEYTREYKLYPFGGDFINTKTGTVLLHTSRVMANSLLGWQYISTIESGRDGEVVTSFNFTGEEFTLSFDSVNDSSMDYELFVDGFSQGVFKTAPSTGVVAGYDQRRKHTFPYIRNKLIEIKTKKTTFVGNQTLMLGGIIVNKKIRIQNNGICGTTAKFYKDRNMSGNTNNDGVALDKYDNFIFVQLGTNDRLKDARYPQGASEFKRALLELVNECLLTGDVILMCSNPVANESPTSYTFNMLDCRNTIFNVANYKKLDFIDNFNIFSGLATTQFTADGLHPNTFGHKRYSQNIINSIEFN